MNYILVPLTGVASFDFYFSLSIWISFMIVPFVAASAVLSKRIVK